METKFGIHLLLMYQTWMFWNSKQHETALVEVISVLWKNSGTSSHAMELRHYGKINNPLNEVVLKDWLINPLTTNNCKTRRETLASFMESISTVGSLST